MRKRGGRGKREGRENEALEDIEVGPIQACEDDLVDWSSLNDSTAT